MAETKTKQAARPAVAELENDRVPVFIPRNAGNGDENFYVSVNGYTALLPRGKTSMVPRFVVNEINRSRRCEEVMWRRQEELQQQA